MHRIGRTGRRNNTGTAYTFFTRNNCKQAGDLISVLREAKQAVNPKLLELSNMRGGGGGRFANNRRWGGTGSNYTPRGGATSGGYGGAGFANGGGFKRKIDDSSFGPGPTKKVFNGY